MKVPKKGGIVFVKDDNMARRSWKFGKIQHLRIGLDDEIRSAEILLPNHTTIVRAINFLYPLELPTLQEEKQELRKDDENMQEQIADRSNIIDEVFSEGQTMEPNTTDRSIYGDKKRKAYLVTRKRIFDCMRDNGTSVLFYLSPGGCHGDYIRDDYIRSYKLDL